jgi:hypothetical protein
MSTETITRPTLREIILDSLTDAYWYRKGEVEDCPACRRNPAGVCADEDHQLSAAAALFYEQARKRIESAPGDPEVLDLLCGNVMAALGGEGE